MRYATELERALYMHAGMIAATYEKYDMLDKIVRKHDIALAKDLIELAKEYGLDKYIVMPRLPSEDNGQATQ